MRLHQLPVAAFAKRLDLDRLLGPAHGLGRVARTEGGVGQRGQRSRANAGELAPLLLDPGSVVARQERPLRQRLGTCRCLPCSFDVAGRERRFGCARRVVGGDDVDPGAGGKLEPVTAELGGQGAAIRSEHAAQLAGEHA